MDGVSRDWIFPIFDGDTAAIGGQCFVVDTFVFTAAHVIDALSCPYTIIGGERFSLSKDNACRFMYNHGNDEDCAVFNLPWKSESSMLLADIEGVQGKLKCKYVGYVHEENGSLSLQLQSSEAQLVRIEGNAFLCNASPMMKEGCSGSPIMTEDGQVVGMLVGGDDVSVCGFQRGQYILSLINQNN